MVVVAPKDRYLCIELRGKVGRPVEVGNHWLGYSEIGDDNTFSGVYQRRKRKTGQIIVKMNYSMPPYVNTAIQQARRTKFASAIASWNALDVDQQIKWNKKVSPARMSGYNRYISWFMKLPDDLAVMGVFQVGYANLGFDYF